MSVDPQERDAVQTSKARFSLTSVLILLLAAVLLAVAVTRWVASVSGGQAQGGVAVTFRGVIASMYPDGSGGCIRAEAGQGVSVADDANCGPLFLVPGWSVKVGDKVSATSIDSVTQDGEAVQGYIVAPRDS